MDILGVLITCGVAMALLYSNSESTSSSSSASSSSPDINRFEPSVNDFVNSNQTLV
jgi:hypothetical protein